MASGVSVCSDPSLFPSNVVESVRCNGTSLSAMWTDTGQDGTCTTTDNANKDGMEPGTTWKRSSYRLTTFGWTLDGPGVGWRSTSGASTKVDVLLKAGRPDPSTTSAGTTTIRSTRIASSPAADRES
jgi:hypothetical protein